MKKIFFLIFILSSFFFFVNCSKNIATILNSPEKFQNKTLTTQGTVRCVVTTEEYSYFILNDGTGNIRIFNALTLPVENSYIKLSGTFDSAFYLNGIKIPALKMLE